MVHIIDMLGGRVLGEGVDGCILSGPMWPCEAGSQGVPDTKDTRYVSKLVSKADTESSYIKLAANLIGPELSSKYLAGLHGECSPANSSHPPSLTNTQSMKASETNIKSWRGAQECSVLKKKIEKKIPISKDSKIMFISKYEATVDTWSKTIKADKATLLAVDKAIPKFIEVLQKLYQQSQQLIHIDLHDGNIFIRTNPLEFGIADFGHCVFRLNTMDEHKTFYGAYLLGYVDKFDFYTGYSQVPLESRLLNFCYRKKMDMMRPDDLINAWLSDNDVKTDDRGFTDLITLNRHNLLKYLLTRVLFIRMVEYIQSISRKIRENSTNSLKLYESLKPNERTVLEFILTRYSILSPINTITRDLIGVYGKDQMITREGTGITNTVKFLLRATIMPYDQDGSSLPSALSAVQGADLRVLWSDVCKGI